jgi:membrane-bound lytic murein transglycosylase D
VTLAALAGCSMDGSGRQQRYTNAFVPPAPRPQAAPPAELPEPPRLQTGFYSKESPILFAAAAPAPPRDFEVETRLRRSEEHMQRGAQLLGEGKTEDARAQFDQAVEWLVTAPAAVNDRQRIVRRYREVIETIYRLEVESAQQTAGDQDPVFDKAPLDDVVELTFPIDPRLKPRVKEQVEATVSQLPLEIADPVLGFINYFSSPRGRKVLIHGLQRSGRYAPMIRRILDEEGLPQELIHMAQAESGFLPRAVSHMRAAGMWQFVRDRGNEYGLKQTPYTDDRFDPERATRAAARHLRDLYAQFGDWYLAIAAYNCGPGNVERAIQRTGYADFWELYKRNVLPRETANYLPIILAMTIMAKNPKDYGIEDLALEEPVVYDTITTKGPTHLALIADITGVSLAAIRELNPAVLKLVAPGQYSVRVPKGTSNMVAAALEAIPESKLAAWRVHRVGTSDTLAAIARQYRTSEKQIQEANGGHVGDAEEGDLLVIPVSYPGATAAPKPAPARKAAAKKPAARKPAPPPRKAAAAPAKGGATVALRASAR